jgi:hypothetical protein
VLDQPGPGVQLGEALEGPHDDAGSLGRVAGARRGTIANVALHGRCGELRVCHLPMVPRAYGRGMVETNKVAAGCLA